MNTNNGLNSWHWQNNSPNDRRIYTLLRRSVSSSQGKETGEWHKICQKATDKIIIKEEYISTVERKEHRRSAGKWWSWQQQLQWRSGSQPHYDVLGNEEKGKSKDTTKSCGVWAEGDVSSRKFIVHDGNHQSVGVDGMAHLRERSSQHRPEKKKETASSRGWGRLGSKY